MTDINEFNRNLIEEFRANGGKVTGTFEGRTQRNEIVHVAGVPGRSLVGVSVLTDILRANKHSLVGAVPESEHALLPAGIRRAMVLPRQGPSLHRLRAPTATAAADADHLRPPSRVPGDQPSVCPPSTVSVWPVTQAAASLQRNRATLATSSGRPRRPQGIERSTAL